MKSLVCIFSLLLATVVLADEPVPVTPAPVPPVAVESKVAPVEPAPPVEKKPAPVVAKPVIKMMEFTGRFCRPCREMQSIVGQLRREVKVEINPTSPDKWEVTSIPTFIAVKDGKEIGRIVGKTTLAELRKLCELPEEAKPVVGEVKKIEPVRTVRENRRDRKRVRGR
jgi:thioredoxin 1